MTNNKETKTPKTKAEIQEQIDGLLKMKATIPQRSFFGNDNHVIINAQIAVLQGKQTPDDFYEDESAEEFNDGDNETYHEADRALRWKNGEEKDNLFE